MKFGVYLAITFVLLSGLSKANKCREYLLLQGTENIVSYGMDTTNNWWAITAPFSESYRLVVNGQKSETYKDIKGLQFSPDGTRWACFAKDNQQWFLLINGTPSALPCSDVGEIQFSPNSEEIVYSYFEADMEVILYRDRKITVVNRKGQLYLSNGAEKIAFIGMRGDKYVMNINGTESHLYDDIIPLGFWYDGKMLYTAQTGNLWEVYKGNDIISEPYMSITYSKINLKGNVAGLIARQQNGKFVSILISDEFYEPLIGKQYDAASGLALHPESSLLAYYAEQNGQPLVVLNNTVYYGGGTSTGNPYFTYNGDELYFFGCDIECFININGRKIQVQAQLSMDLQYAMKPGSMTIAYSTNSSMIMRDLNDGMLYAGIMVDELIQPRYNWRSGNYECLGKISNRLYLMSCKP